jgi:hypothetical protein
MFHNYRARELYLPGSVAFYLRLAPAYLLNVRFQPDAVATG